MFYVLFGRDPTTKHGKPRKKLAEVHAPCIREAEELLHPDETQRVERLDLQPFGRGCYEGGKRQKRKHKHQAT